MNEEFNIAFKQIVLWTLVNKSYIGYTEKSLYKNFLNNETDTALQDDIKAFSFNNKNLSESILFLQENNSNPALIESFLELLIKLSYVKQVVVPEYQKLILLFIAEQLSVSEDTLRELFSTLTNKDLLPIGHMDQKNWYKGKVCDTSKPFINYYKTLSLPIGSDSHAIQERLKQVDLEDEAIKNIEFILLNPAFRIEYNRYLNTLTVINKIKKEINDYNISVGNTPEIIEPTETDIETTSKNFNYKITYILGAFLIIGSVVASTFLYSNEEPKSVIETPAIDTELAPITTVEKKFYTMYLNNDNFMTYGLPTTITNNNTIIELSYYQKPLQFIPESTASLEPVVVEPPKEYIEYVINDSDSLFTISERFNTPMHVIQELNAIKNPNLIFSGQTLLIPTDI
jgi:LysM repeat protein